ncbi:hypothetical protein B0H14DRAFT_3529850 [Mycena olivaceomarginata]|nr:hypothetical protein B0H14DRAFT_3529850 [Mycena olivaceomarginata]
MLSGSMSATTTLLLLLRRAELVVLVQRGGVLRSPWHAHSQWASACRSHSLAPILRPLHAQHSLPTAPAPRDCSWMCSGAVPQAALHTMPGTTTPVPLPGPHSPPRRYALSPSLASLSACTAPALAVALPPGHPHSEIVRPTPPALSPLAAFALLPRSQ